MARRTSTQRSTQPQLSPAAAAGLFQEHSVVTLFSGLELEDGRMLPPGAAGAVVGIWKKGAAYEVEFNEPFHAVVTIPAEALRQAGRASG
jgi:hypothetical protein